MTPGSQRRVALALAGAATLVAAGCWWLRRPAPAPATRGAAVAARLGCFACHGPGGTGGIANPQSQDREVPAWDGGTAMMYVERPEEIREWILYGAPKRLIVERAAASKAGTQDGKQPLILMPAYEGRLSERELDDLIAYFKAVAAYGPRPSDPLISDGRAIARDLGCFGCHGPAGAVAMPNPGSFKGVIPAWVGDDFEQLVRDDDELARWILDGGIKRLDEHPIARRFIARQAVPMPAYREVLEDGELEALIAYIRFLRGERPDSAEPK